MTNLQPTITELHKAFDLFNEEFFESKLPPVVITIQSQGKRSAYGWFSVNKVWSDNENMNLHEINISAEHIGSRGMVDVLQTLLHEMLHLYASENNVKETSRGGTYHNKQFKAIAENFGMEYNHEGPDSKIGFSAVELTENTKNLIMNWDLNQTAFEISRLANEEEKKKKKKSNIVKWVCGCDTIIRSSKPEINVICADCGTKFEKVESEGGDDE